MKEIKINVPDNQAELFAEKLSALIKECGGETNLGTENKEKDLYDTSIPIWERIKTVEDAIAYTGMTLPDCIGELPLDVQAMMKLRIVCAAYNELTVDELDQFPLFTEDEYRYYPWFWLYTKEEIDKMDEEERSRVLGRSATVRMRARGSLTRSRLTPPRPRTRASAVGSASKRESWLRSAESVSQNCGVSSLLSSKKKTESNRGNSPIISLDFPRRKKSSDGQAITPSEDFLCK